MRRGATRRGMVLIVTLWVLTILAVLALTFAATMHVESRAAHNQMQRVRARYVAHAGLQRAITAIQADQTGYVSELSEWAYLDSEEEEFPFPDDERYEVLMGDECGKVDLNSADQELLEKLPQLTPELIDCILDWRDDDDDTRPDGAEADYYGSVMPPHACANRDFLSLNELLLVRGMSKEVLYGSRATRPQAVAASLDEPESEEVNPLEDVLTLFGGTNDLTAQGQDRVNINTCEAEELSEAAGEVLGEGDVQAIVSFRDRRNNLESIGDLLQVDGITREKMQQLADLITTRSVPEATDEEQPGGPEPTDEEPSPADPSLPGMPGGGMTIPGVGGDGARGALEALADVAGQALPGMPGGAGGQPTPGGFPDPTQPQEPGQPGEEEPREGPEGGEDVLDLPTPDEYRAGGYNINTAPIEVLLTLEGMTEQAAQSIIEERGKQPFTTRGVLLNLSQITDDLFAQIVEEVSVRSGALKLTAIGSVEDGRVRVRVTAIVDLKDSAQIVYTAEG